MERFQDCLDDHPKIQKGLRSRNYGQWHYAATTLMKIVLYSPRYRTETIEVFRFGSENCGYVYFPATGKGLMGLSNHITAGLGEKIFREDSFGEDETGSPLKLEQGEITRDEWESLNESEGC